MSVVLPTQPRPRPTPTITGETLLIIGEPKAGKTRLAMDWPNCLVIDTQGGARSYAGMTYDVRAVADESGRSDLEVLREVVAHLKRTKAEGYDAVALDTLDDVSGWMESEACARVTDKHNKKPGYYPSIEDIPHGSGWLEHRRMVMGLVSTLMRLPCTKLIIAHSRRLIDEDSEKTSKIVDLPGKLAHWVPGEVQHIGIAHRDFEGNYLLDFTGYEVKTTKGSVVRQAGSRFPEWQGKVLPNRYEALIAALKGEDV